MKIVQAVRLPLNGLVLAAVGVEALGRPVYRPMAAWIDGWRLSQALDAFVGKLPAYAILVTLAVRFAVAEPAKVVGVYWMGSGHFGPGLLTILMAYGASILVGERIYEAGKPKLLTIGWFAKLIGWAGQLKDTALETLHGTRVWIVLQAMRQRLKAWLGQ